MKFPGIYKALQARRNSYPGLRITDKSGWLNTPQSLVDHWRPLWIIVEDAGINKRLWITQYSSSLQITTAQLDLDAKSQKYSKSYRYYEFKTQGKMADFLNRLFTEKKEGDTGNEQTTPRNPDQ